MEAHILYVDDNPTDRELYRAHLEHAGFSVNAVGNGQEALAAIFRRRPDLIILDYRLVGVTGAELTRQLRENPAARDIPILVYTNFASDKLYVEADDSGANDLLEKGVSHDRLIRKVRSMLSSSRRPAGHVVMTLTTGSVTRFEFGGSMTRSWEGGPMRLDRPRFNKDMADLAESIYEYHDHWLELLNVGDRERAAEYIERRRGWRRQATDKGRDVYKAILQSDPDFLLQWGALSEPFLLNAPERVTLRFRGPVEDLVLPFELINDGQGLPWSVRHPVSRQISNASTSGDTWRSFLAKRRGQSIRALLLAGDEAATGEVQQVAERLRTHCGDLGVGIDITPSDLSRPATLEDAEEWLGQKSHDLVHYAGHGVFHTKAPELSYLVFRRQDGGPGKLTTIGLHRLLTGSRVQFLYLSCCCGAEIGDPAVLGVNSFVGLIHAAVLAGVPSVLGYRWPVVGVSAERFAASFYEGITRIPSSLEYAALLARREVFEAAEKYNSAGRWEEGGWDDAWFSPILIVQNPDS
jgi:CheY-like chemotaxis protein